MEVARGFEGLTKERLGVMAGISEETASSALSHY